jgi:uncharacterized glyoxalase superfamily protein PhnB
MTAFTALTPNLMVRDVTETLAWYDKHFDAEELGRMPAHSDDPEWAQVAIGDVSLMFQERSSLEDDVPALEGSSLGGSFTCYIDVDDAAGLHDELQRADVRVVQELRETAYGRREFAIEDCNGYVLAFGEKLG